MNIKIVIGITLGLAIAYALAKRFFRSNAASLEYRKTMQDLLTNEKHQVKGKFE